MADAVRGYYMPDNIVQSYCLKRQRFSMVWTGIYGLFRPEKFK